MSLGWKVFQVALWSTADSGWWTLNAGRWALDAGLWTQDSGRWTLDIGLWMLDSKWWTLDSRLWTLDSRFWTLDTTLWTLGSGHCTLLLTGSKKKNQSSNSNSTWLNYWKFLGCESLRTSWSILFFIENRENNCVQESFLS